MVGMMLPVVGPFEQGLWGGRDNGRIRAVLTNSRFGIGERVNRR